MQFVSIVSILYLAISIIHSSLLFPGLITSPVPLSHLSLHLASIANPLLSFLNGQLLPINFRMSSLILNILLLISFSLQVILYALILIILVTSYVLNTSTFNFHLHLHLKLNFIIKLLLITLIFIFLISPFPTRFLYFIAFIALLKFANKEFTDY